MIGARRLLILAFIMWCTTICRPVVVTILGRDVPVVFPLLQAMAVGVLALATLRYRASIPAPPPAPLFTLQQVLFLLATLTLTVYGLLRAEPWRHVVYDALVFLMVLCFLALGRYDRVWRDLEKPLLVLFWISVPLVLLGTQFARPEIDEGFGHAEFVTSNLEGERGSVATLAYRIQHLLTMWPLLFAMAYFRPRMDPWKLLGLATVAVAVVIEVYFQKRAPILRTLSYAFVALALAPILQRKLRVGTMVLLLTGFAGLAAVVVTSDSFERLMDRFESAEPLSNNSRFLEASAMLEDLGFIEWFVGRGMGGSYEPPSGWEAGTVLIRGREARTSLHVGILYPMLKGGLLFTAIVYAAAVPMLLLKRPGWYGNRFNAAAMSVLPVYIAFLVIEGPASLTNPFATALFGLTAARACTPSVPDDSPMDGVEPADGNAYVYDVEPEFEHTR